MDAKATVQGIKGRVTERWAVFRAQSVYFQLKTLVLVLYGTVVAVTLLWAPPSTVAKNQIGAHILVLEGDLVVGRYFIVQNDSRSHWRNVSFEIDDGYTVSTDLVPAGDKVTLYVKDFRKKVIRKRRGREIAKTMSAPADMNVTFLRVSSSEGGAMEPIAPRAAVATP